MIIITLKIYSDFIHTYLNPNSYQTEFPTNSKIYKIMILHQIFSWHHMFQTIVHILTRWCHFLLRTHFSSNPTGDVIILITKTSEFPKFPMKIVFGRTNSVNETISNAHVYDSAHARLKSPKWTTDEHLVLLNRWTKYGIYNIININQKSEAYWSKIYE